MTVDSDGGWSGSTAEEFFAGRLPLSGRWSSIADWRGDDSTLMALYTYPRERQAPSLLPYGIERLGQRHLVLAVPEAAVDVTRHRAAFLDASVDVYARRDSGFSHVEVPTEAIAWYGSLGQVADARDADAFDGPPWLVSLVDWLESRRVERIRRGSYWSWHYRGRQVLRVQGNQRGFRLDAGVNYSDPQHDQPAPLRVEIPADQEPGDATLAQLRAQLDGAIERRRVGDDRDHREHLLQAALGVDAALLGMNEMHREFPAWRPALEGGGARGFIDFLGVDIDGGLHVIETKIGPDHMLGVQGIDYWAWVTAHKQEIAHQVGADPEGSPVQLHFVVACNPKALFHGAAAETIRFIRNEVPWRCHVIDDWNTVDRPNQLLRPHIVPGIGPRTIPPDTVCQRDNS